MAGCILCTPCRTPSCHSLEDGSSTIILACAPGAVLFCAIIFLGSAIVAFASNLGENSASDAVGPFAIAIVGRFVFGLGGESLTVAQNAIVARWFKSHSLATAFAICVSFSRVGSATNFIIERPIVSQWGFPVALWTSAVFCAVSALAGVLLWFLDRRGERVRAVEKADLSGDDVALGKVTEVLQIDHILLYLICVAFYVAVFVFVQVAAVFFQLKYDISKADASIAVGIPYTVSAILSPFLGFIIDKLGYSLQLVVFACLNLAGFHLSLYYLDIPPIASMVWLGATYSVAAASIWPMVALIVEEDTLATAYGLMTAIQNLGLAVAPLISGMILEGSGPLLDKYLRLELLFTGCAIFAVILCLILGIVDSRRDGILISSSKEVEKIRACKVKAKSSTALHPEEIIISPRTHTTLRTNYLRLLNIQHTYQGSR